MKPAIPPVIGKPASEQQFFDAVRENIEIITGRRRGHGKIAPLPANATLTDVITKINELIERLQ